MMTKHYALFAVSMMLAGACSDADTTSPDQIDQVEQHTLNGGGGFINPNGYTERFTGTVINAAGDPNQLGTPIKGIHLVPAHYVGGRLAAARWYVMSETNDNAAVIDSITYGGTTVTTLSSGSGWLYVTLSGQTTAIAATTQTLSMHVGLPFNGTILIGPSGDTTGNAGKRYVANFQPDGSSQQFWMNPDLKPDISVNCTVYHVCSGPHNSYLVPIAGTKWDLTTGATVADTNAVAFVSGADSVGGCVGWGYLPWTTTQVCGYNGLCSNVSMAPYHQSCARMKRADFCGDGRAWTLGESDPFNVLIQAWDTANVHAMTPQSWTTMEAAWSPTGATCVNQGQLRTVNRTMSDGQGHTFDAATSCSAPLPSCENGASLYTGSARPCTQTDASGTCIAN